MANDKLIYASAARRAILKENPKLAYCIDEIPGVDVPKWIPVSERLPKEWEDVLVWSWCGFCEVAVYLGTPGKWRVCWNHTLLEEHSVTHWMPLPEPPKEGE